MYNYFESIHDVLKAGISIQTSCVELRHTLLDLKHPIEGFAYLRSLVHHES